MTARADDASRVSSSILAFAEARTDVDELN